MAVIINKLAYQQPSRSLTYSSVRTLSQRNLKVLYLKKTSKEISGGIMHNGEAIKAEQKK